MRSVKVSTIGIYHFKTSLDSLLADISHLLEGWLYQEIKYDLRLIPQN
jgi:hypothetical protein